MKMDFSFRISSDLCVSRVVNAEAVAMYSMSAVQKARQKN